jgi:prepilin-type N-terminal cleavage/methylation domain-containing protein
VLSYPPARVGKPFSWRATALFHHRRGFTIIELLTVIAIIGVLAALLIPAIQASRESSRRSACLNKLRQIGLSLASFHDANGYYPLARQANKTHLAPSQFAYLPDHLIGVGSPGDSFPPRLEQVGSWLLRIQPFMEESATSELWQQAYTLEDVYEAHRKVSQLVIAGHLCPSDPKASQGLNPWGYAMNSYLAVSGNNEFVDEDGHASNASNGPFPTQNWSWSKRPRVKAANVTAGLSKVTFVGERPISSDRYFGRWNMTDFDTVMANPSMEFSVITADGNGFPCPSPGYFRNDDQRNPCAATHFWSLHPGGGAWLLGDGAVVFLDYSAATSVLPAMASVNASVATGDVYTTD